MALGERLEELSTWESRLVMRSRLIPNYIKLVFRSQPVSSLDPVGELDTRYDGSAEFCILRDWLAMSSDYLRDLPPTGHKAADNQLLALLSKFDENLARLENILSEAWTREMVEMGLLFATEFRNSSITVYPRKPVPSQLIAVTHLRT